MNDNDKLHIGLVGCGYHGQALAQAVLRSETQRFVACADPDGAAAAEVAHLGREVSAHATVGELLDSADVDAVLIATPHDQLAPAALAAIRAGKGVLIEKPMALNADQAAEIEYAAASADVTCMIGYSFRYGMARHVHDLLAQGVIGELQAVTGAIGTGPMDDGWTGRPESGGGPLMYVGCHLVDLALWFFDQEPTNVSAAIHLRPDNGTDATSAITLDFTGGRLAQILVTQLAHGFFYDLRAIGRSGSIALSGRNFVQFAIEVHSTTDPAYKEPTTIHPTMGGDHITMMLMPELAEFENAVRERRTPAVTAADGRRVLRILDDAHRSSDSHRVVPVVCRDLLASGIGTELDAAAEMPSPGTASAGRKPK